MAEKIFDCFMFFNEVELLDLRLHTLYDHVDYFVVVEAIVAFQGDVKPLYFEREKNRFEKFFPKMIHVVVEDIPNRAGAWDLEHFQRNALRRGFGAAAPEDIIIISDADELLRPETVSALRSLPGFTQLRMPM